MSARRKTSAPAGPPEGNGMMRPSQNMPLVNESMPVQRICYGRKAEFPCLLIRVVNVQNGVMHITEAALNEFIDLYKEEFGQQLSHEEASEMSFRLLTLYELLNESLPSEQ